MEKDITVIGNSTGMTITESARLGCATASCGIERVGATDGVISIDMPWTRYGQMSLQQTDDI